MGTAHGADAVRSNERLGHNPQADYVSGRKRGQNNQDQMNPFATPTPRNMLAQSQSAEVAAETTSGLISSKLATRQMRKNFRQVRAGFDPGTDSGCSCVLIGA